MILTVQRGTLLSISSVVLYQQTPWPNSLVLPTDITYFFVSLWCDTCPEDRIKQKIKEGGQKLGVKKVLSGTKNQCSSNILYLLSIQEL